MQVLSAPQTSLFDIATTIWKRRGAAKRSGLPFNEETATELLLLDLKHAFPREVRIIPFNKQEEAMVGADWAWAFVDADGTHCQPMLVQAKRLDDADERYRQLRHRGGQRQGSAASQMDKLIDTATQYALPPVYAFYNHLDNPNRIIDNCRSIAARVSPNTTCWGVTIASALAVRSALPDISFDRQRRHSRPLHCLLCTQGAGDHAQTSLVEAASLALTALFSDGLAPVDVDAGIRPPFRPMTTLPDLFLRAVCRPSGLRWPSDTCRTWYGVLRHSRRGHHSRCPDRLSGDSLSGGS